MSSRALNVVSNALGLNGEAILPHRLLLENGPVDAGINSSAVGQPMYEVTAPLEATASARAASIPDWLASVDEEDIDQVLL